MGLRMWRGVFGLVPWVQVMDETDAFLSSGDSLTEPQTPLSACNRHGSPVTHGSREGEGPYCSGHDFGHPGSPSPEHDEGSGTQSRGLLSQGKEMVGKLNSALLGGTNWGKPPPPVLIAVMGKTGTGKTSFINAITGGGLTVGHGLESCECSLSATFPFIYLNDFPSN